MRRTKLPNSNHDAICTRKGNIHESNGVEKNAAPPVGEDIYDALIQKILEKYKSVFDYLEKR